MNRPGTQTEVPSTCLWYNNRGGQNHNNRGVGFECDGTKVCSFTIHKVTVHTDIGPASLDMFTHRVQFRLYDTTTHYLGQAVASTYERANDSPNLWMSHVLVYVEHTRSATYNQNWDITTATYPTANYGFRVTTQKAQGNTNLYINMQQGSWYIIVYAVYGQSLGSYKVGENVIATKGNGTVSEEAHEYALHTSHFRTGLFPAYMTGLTLTPFTTSTITYDGTLREGDPAQEPEEATYELDPSFGCDDSFEFPPPPSEEDLADDEDEFEDPEDPEKDEDEELELGPDDDYSDPPISRLVVHPDAQQVYEHLRARFPDREARLAANQLIPSGEYTQFTEMYHNALVDGLSPREARAFALGL